MDFLTAYSGDEADPVEIKVPAAKKVMAETMYMSEYDFEKGLNTSLPKRKRKRKPVQKKVPSTSIAQHYLSKSTMDGKGEKKNTPNGWQEEDPSLAEARAAHSLSLREAYLKEPTLVDTTTSEFMGSTETDYKGSSWFQAPKATPPAQCRIPKRHVHTFDFKQDKVQTISFIPKYGHLLASGHSTGMVYLSSTLSYAPMRSYDGHHASVQSLDFAQDGQTFVTAGLDALVRQWDAETGASIFRIHVPHMPFAVIQHPVEPCFLVGCGDGKIYQYDTRQGVESVQIYDRHLSKISDLLFLDQGNKFVSCALDKTIRVWDYGTPVPIKHISSPSMHAVCSLRRHPNNACYLGTSMDNQILTFKSVSPFRKQGNKSFHGHQVSGYACRPDVSPDGKWVTSGDAHGNVFIWSWSHTKVQHRMHPHQGVVIDTAWHPLGNMLATASWDGTTQLFVDG